MATYGGTIGNECILFDSLVSITLPDFTIALDAWFDNQASLLGSFTSGQPLAMHPASYGGTIGNGPLNNFLYGKIYFTPSAIDVGYIASEKDESYVLWNANFSSVEVTDWSWIGDTDGVTHTPPRTPTYTIEPIEEVEFDFVFDTNGDPAIDLEYVLTIDGTDYTVAFSGYRLLVLPFDQIDQVEEALEYLTDKGESWNDACRVASREIPRQTLAINCMVQNSNNLFFNALIFGWGANLFGIPLRKESEIVGALSIGATIINVDTRYAQYFTGGLIFVMDDIDTYEAAIVESKTDSQITLTKGLKNSYRNALVCPMRSAYMQESGMKDQRIHQSLNKKTLSFIVVDNEAITAGSYTQYAGYDVLEDIPLITNPIDASIVHPVKMHDGKVGNVKPYVTRDVVRVGDQIRWKPNTPEKLWALRQWIHARKGAQKPFWLPLWRKDFILQNAIGGSDTTITVDFCFAEFLVGEHIMIRLKNNTRIYRQIGAGTVDTQPNNSVIDIGTSLGLAVAVDDIDRITLMILVTQTDKTTLQHANTYSEIVAAVQTL